MDHIIENKKTDRDQEITRLKPGQSLRNNARSDADLLKTLTLKNKELESILSITSHDLRVPLINIQGFCYELSDAYDSIRKVLERKKTIGIIENETRSALNERIPEALDYILESVNKINSLLNGLLKFSRLGLADIKIQKTDMNLIITDVLASMRYQIKQKNVDIQKDILPSCYADSVQINHVFANLIHNAIKFLDQRRPGKIHIYSNKDGEYNTYCVEDNGIGIDRQNHNKIFEIFHQIKPDLQNGQGLGLSIVKRIIDRHQGKVSLKSKKGLGSKFFVSLPNAGFCKG